MSEQYTAEGVLELLKSYIAGDAEGVLDGYEIIFPQGTNHLDPLFTIKHVKVDATFDEQVELTRAMILNRPVQFKYWGEAIGDFQLNDLSHSFAGFPVFEVHPIALRFLIQTCFTVALKNLLPPLSDSQSMAMKAMRGEIKKEEKVSK